LAEKKGSPNYSGASGAVIAFGLSTIRIFGAKNLIKQRRVFAWTRFSFKSSKAFIELGSQSPSLATGLAQLHFFFPRSLQL
jgi:hypothetical protein